MLASIENNSTPTPTKAPIPTLFADFGMLSFQHKNKIKPTVGKNAPKTPHQALPESTGFAGSTFGSS